MAGGIWIRMKIDNLNMKKEKRYWLRGGLMLAVIGFIIAVIFRLMTIFGVNLDSPFNVYLIVLAATGPGFPLIILLFSLLGCNSFMNEEGSPQYCSNDIVQSIIILSSVVIAYFILGAIIGWIYGKMKNRGEK